jgi:hypothetical protein
LYDVSLFSNIFIVFNSIDVSRNGRLPTKLFTNEYQEKQKQRAKPVRQQKLTQEELEKSRTRPEEVIYYIENISQVINRLII